MVAPELKQRIQTVLVHAQSTDAEEEPKILNLNLNASACDEPADGLVEMPAKIQVRAGGEEDGQTGPTRRHVVACARTRVYVITPSDPSNVPSTLKVRGIPEHKDLLHGVGPVTDGFTAVLYLAGSGTLILKDDFDGG